MKKLLFTAVAVLGFVGANAQEVKFGAKAGLNLANFTGDVENNKMLTSFYVGGFAEIKIEDKFSVQPELLFSVQGAKSESSSSQTIFGQTLSTTSKSTSKFNYINIPVIAKYYVVDKLSLQAGPQFGFLVSVDQTSESSTTYAGETETSSDSNSSKEGLNTFDLGLNFGAGYDINENIGVDVRYNLGLTKINKEGDGSVKNAVIQLGVNYKF